MTFWSRLAKTHLMNPTHDYHPARGLAANFPPARPLSKSTDIPLGGSKDKVRPKVPKYCLEAHAISYSRTRHGPR